MTTAASPLGDRLPPLEEANPDDSLDRFLDYVAKEGLTLYSAQEEALLELFGGKNVILATPTGSGKSLVALGMHFLSLAQNYRSVYTAPIKALVNEKFFALCKAFGADNVGMLTGDASVNAQAPILCCTAEVLANMALRLGAETPVDHIIIDEFHYYADKDRGVAWQIPLLTLRHASFLLMSATIGPTEGFEKILTRLNNRPTVTVSSNERPVPLEFEYRETALHESIPELVRRDRAPIYLVNFTQRGAAEEAQNLMSVDFATKDEKKAINAELAGFRFDSPYGKDLQRYVRHGIGLHHAGLLPKYRLLVEKLAQKGLLKVISGTDTLGVGVNIPIRTVLFTKLCKYDGEKTAILSVRDFKQIAGRAGRKGFDTSGTVAAQAPEHVIENLRLEAKAGSDPVKKKRIVRRKPPERGYVHWDKATFEKLISSPPEPLRSRFQVTHGMILNVLQRERGGCLSLGRLIRDSHETKHDKKVHARQARALYKALEGAGIVERTFDEETGATRVRVSLELQEEFSINHTLALWLLDTINLLDRESPEYALQLLTMVESILEDPDLILQKQLDQLKTEKMAEMKAAGVEYDERIAELDKMEYPKPHREFVYGTFNQFAAKHPWVGTENIRPKSVARDMIEKFLSFAEYVKEYGLERAEGLVLRYMSDVYKVLVQTVPESARDEGVDEIITYLRAVVRQVDSSLLDEWERIRKVGANVDQAPSLLDEPTEGVDITRDYRGFRVLVRNAMFGLLRALAFRDWESAAELASGGEEPWAAVRFEEAMKPYFEEHNRLGLDPAARSPQKTMITVPSEFFWEVKQVISDPAGNDDWVIEARIDLARSALAARPILEILRIGS
jgi:superfamily II RNA helicase